MKFEKRRWDLVHQCEEEIESRHLKCMTSDKSFKTILELYKFANLINRDFFKKQNKEKLNILIKTHAAFNKVRS